MKTQRSTTQRESFVHNILLATIFALAQVSLVYAQTSTFTYQGRFTEGGTAANGTYDMQFTLFDGTGNQIGQTITNNSVAVTNGVFTVQLDYGAAGFTGADRLLEIGVRRAGSGEAYTVLSPRQPITSAPYAIRAGATTTADTATNASQLGGVAASEYVQTNDSRLTDTRTPSAGSSNYIQNTNSQQVANFNISGNGTTGGTLSASVVNSAVQYNIGGNRVFRAGTQNNTFVGLGAGNADVDGAINTFVGAFAGFDSNANANSFFGAFAGRFNTTGSANSFFGYESGNLSTGSGNSFFGTTAGKGGLGATGSDNSFFGISAGSSNTTASENAFFGASAGRENKTGAKNSFFGADAGRNNISASGNSFFGHKAGRENSGNFNSFFGSNAGTANTIGVSNSFFGADAGAANKEGGANSFFGAAAGNVNTSGDGNSFFGSLTGSSNETGSKNSFFGTLAGSFNRTASDSSYFGYHSGEVSTGASNSFFGSASGEENKTGFANSFFGMGSGGSNVDGFNNAFFGRGAGNANFSGNSNTIIGAFADVDSGGLSFATAIGSGAHVGTSNTIVLGRANASDGVRVPGTLTLSTLGTAGAISLCRNVLNQLSTCSSSLRYKKDLAPFTRGLALLNQLKPITFKWKADDSSDLGFGAEEIAAVEPLLVTRNDKGEIEGVKYDRITAILVNAVKEQQAQIARQQTEIASLKRLVCRSHQNAGVCK